MTEALGGRHKGQRSDDEFSSSKISQVRVTCNYDNTTQQAVTYGQSTNDETCWLVLLLVGSPTGCVLGSAPIFGEM